MRHGNERLKFCCTSENSCQFVKENNTRRWHPVYKPHILMAGKTAYDDNSFTVNGQVSQSVTTEFPNIGNFK